MIHVYWQTDTELGFTFHLFGPDHYVNDFNKFETSMGQDAYFRTSRFDIIFGNLNRIYLDFYDDPVEKPYARVEAEKRLQSALEWIGTEKDACYSDPKRLYKLCKTLLKTEKFMTTLVNSVTGKQRETAIMQWRLFYDYLRSEVKSYDENVPGA